jgi:hypothetical protein
MGMGTRGERVKSPCCGEPVRIDSSWVDDIDNAVRSGTTYWYACTSCGRACDPIEWGNSLGGMSRDMTES